MANSGGLSRYQNFRTMTVHRSQLRNAEYNPRIMDKGAMKRLREGIKKHGLVQPIIWNSRTGNIVGGHQRVRQLDSLERSEDYELTVAVIDVDEREEAEINVQLNNTSMQGEWDLDLLASLATEYDLSFDDMGFSDTDVDILFDGDERFTELFDTDEAQTVKGKLGAIKENRSQMNDRLKDENGINWYAVVIFGSEAEREDFFRRIHVPAYEQYVTVDQIERIARG